GSIRRHADGLCASVAAPSDEPARLLQARLIDAAGQVIDAVPRGGGVRLIRDPEADEPSLRALLGGARPQPAPARLEDGFMVLLRGRRDAALPRAAPVSTDRRARRDGPAVIEVHDLVRRL